MTYISKNLRYLRRLARLSQQELANEIDLNRGNIASYEKGSAEPSFKNLIKIKDFFKIDLQDFIEKDLAKEIESDNFQIRYDDSGINIVSEVAEKVVNDEIEEEVEEVRMMDQISPQQLATQSKRLEKVIDGFKKYHRYKFRKYEVEQIEECDMKKELLEYGKLIQITEEILSINKQLLHLKNE